MASLKEVRIGEIDFIIIDRTSMDQPHKVWENRCFEQFEKKELADPEFTETKPIDLIFSAEIWARVIEEEIRRETHGLIAQKSKFGWLIFGGRSETEASNMSCLNVNTVSHTEIERLIRNLWESEEIPEPRQLTLDEQWCEENFAKTHV